MANRCTALTRSGNKCGNNAKFGTFCGVHIPGETEPVCKVITYCSAITLTNKKCTRQATSTGLCCKHVLKNPDHDFAELDLYHPDVGWPWKTEITRWVRKFSNGRALHEHMKYIGTVFGVTTGWITDEGRNKYTMVLIELFFRNSSIDFSGDHWKEIITELQEKINFPFLKEYRELFRRKFDESYRIETQKNYQRLVIEKTLGTDMSKKIIEI